MRREEARAAWEPKEVPLASLPIGSEFVLRLETTGREIRGKLLRLSLGSATVKLDAGNKRREFDRVNPVSGESETVSFAVPSEITHWSLSTLVIPITVSTAITEPVED